MGERGVRGPRRVRPTTSPRWRASCARRSTRARPASRRNRFRAHMSRSGKVVPGTFAPAEELTAIARAVGEAGHGLIQGIADGTITPGEPDAMPELDLLAELSLVSGRPLTFSTFQASTAVRRVPPGARRRRGVERARRAAATADHPPRGHVHDQPRHLPPVHEPADLQGAGRPAGRRTGRADAPARGARRDPRRRGRVHRRARCRWWASCSARAVGRLFSLAFPVDYEPDPSQSVAALARQLGRRAAALPLRPHDRGRRQRVLRAARQQLPRRHARAVPGDAARSVHA